MRWAYLDIRTISGREYEAWYAMADSRRREKCDACRVPEDRLRSLGGDHLARMMIARHCGVEPGEIRFGRTEAGKPYAAGLDVHFNISHSGDFVVCALSEKSVGIDVERIRPVRDRLAQKVCTQRELDWIREAPGWGAELTGVSMRRFFRVWTAKEAYFKWAGTGITGLKAIDTLAYTHETFELDGHMVSIYEE